MNDDGTMARVKQLTRFARRHGLALITIADLIKYRMRNDRLVKRIATARLPTDHGLFQAYAFESVIDGETHVAVVRGDIGDGRDILVRVHSRCLTGDVFHSSRCDCGRQLDAAMQRIASEGRGVLLYLNQEGRGIGLGNKLRAYELQDQGLDTVEANERLGFKADQRDYGIGAQILRDLGVQAMRLLTNNPRKFVGLEGYGLSVGETVPLEVSASAFARAYLKTKKEKLGHNALVGYRRCSPELQPCRGCLRIRIGCLGVLLAGTPGRPAGCSRCGCSERGCRRGAHRGAHRSGARQRRSAARPPPGRSCS